MGYSTVDNDTRRIKGFLDKQALAYGLASVWVDRIDLHWAGVLGYGVIAVIGGKSSKQGQYCTKSKQYESSMTTSEKIESALPR